MTETTKQYNYCIDFIKGIACICVVLMHCEFPGELGTIVQSMSRFCVPFFFMVSGYFATDMTKYMDDGRCKFVFFNRKVLHIARIALWAALFYIVFALIQYIIWEDIPLKVNKTQILLFFFFNEPFIIAGQLWFLFALLYDYILIAILDKFNLQKIEMNVGVLILVLFYLLGQGVHIMGGGIPVPDFVISDLGGIVPHMEGNKVPVPNFLYRNFLFEGFAFFMLGRFISNNSDKLKFRNSTLIIVIVISTFLCLVERQLVGRDFGVNLCTLPQVVALFVYGINNSNRHRGVIQKLGKDCSMLVYVLHPFVWHSMERVYVVCGVADNLTALYILPIIVVLFTIALSSFCNWVTRSIQLKRQMI